MADVEAAGATVLVDMEYLFGDREKLSRETGAFLPEDETDICGQSSP